MSLRPEPDHTDLIIALGSLAAVYCLAIALSINSSV